MKYKSIIIAGPTASGKSDFAHKLAQRVNGAIINCDSVQIYSGIESVSASPFADMVPPFDSFDGVPYELFSIFSLDKHISVVDYLNLARDAMNRVIKSGKIPIFVGGSGYYINVLVNGIASIPEISDEVRMRARQMVKDDIESVYKLLPDDFVRTDPQRTARALEVFLETGEHLSQWQKMPRNGALIPDAFKILIMPERETLISRIANRIPKMLDSGAIKEAQNIINNNLNEERAIGTAQLCKMLRGEISEDQAIESWITKTNQYAKRQRTWFRGQYAADYQILHVPTDKDVEQVIQKIA